MHSMDPVTLLFDSATALASALALFFSRLDAHRSRISESPDIRSALWAISWILSEWHRYSLATNQVLRSWAEGSIDDASLARQIVPPVKGQGWYHGEMEEFLQGNDKGRNVALVMRHILKIYGPEVLKALEEGFGQRSAALRELGNELPSIRASKPEAIRIMLERLNRASGALKDAAEELRRFLQENFPLSEYT
jgi:hypothetical protein